MPTSPYPDLPLDICGEIFTAVLREIRAITLLEPVVFLGLLTSLGCALLLLAVLLLGIGRRKQGIGNRT